MLDENCFMDATAEFTLQRLLEAENTAKLFMEVTREMNSHIKILQFRLNDSLRHKSVEETLKDSKIAELTEMNILLTEELEFLKASEMNSEKISLLGKQVRDLEKEAQVSMASSEASKKQQDLLYAAIWDMETLIEDLKSKVFKAEMRSEKAEDQCLVLAESNSKLNEEIGFLKVKGESLEASLKEVYREKDQRVKDINDGAKIVGGMILKLAVERERIQKQVSSLVRENGILTAELQRARKRFFESANIDCSKECHSLANGICAGVKNPSRSDQNSLVKVNDATSNEIEESMSTSIEDFAGDPSNGESRSGGRTGKWGRGSILMAIIVPVISAGAIIFRQEKSSTLRHFLHLF